MVDGPRSGLRTSSLHGACGDRLCGGDFWRRLGGKDELQALEQELQIGLGLCVALEAQFAAVGGRNVHIDHLHSGEFLQCAACGEAWGERLQSQPQADVQAVGKEGEEYVRFDACLLLMEDWPDGENRPSRFGTLPRL